MIVDEQKQNRKETRKDAFVAGFFVGLTVIGGIAAVLLLFFWL